jgi:hypothetical protein
LGLGMALGAPRLTATQSEVAAMDIVLGSNDIGNLTAGSAFRTRTTRCDATHTRSPPSTANQTV